MAGAGAGHETYREGSARLAYGLDENGRLRHISEVDQGLACGCQCPACESPLIARRPKAAVWHFAHLTNNECSGAAETALHLLAKEVLEEHKRLWLPSVEAMLDGRVERAYSAIEMRFDAAILEHRLDGVTPDIILSHGDKDLVVEIAVTHACEPEKVLRLAGLRLPGIEIDLSLISREALRGEVAEAVISTAPRIWLWNSKIDAAKEKLRSRIAEEELEKQRKLDREANDFLEQYDKLADQPFVGHSALEPTIQLVTELGFGPVTSLPVKGEKVFRVEPRAWQSVLFKHYIINRPPNWVLREDFDATDAFAVLMKCNIVSKLFGADARSDMIEHTRTLRPDLVMPHKVLGEYFALLAARGFLKSDGGSFVASVGARNKVKEREDGRAASAQRAEHLDERVKWILSLVDVETRSSFDLPTWSQARHDPLSKSPAELARDDGKEWHQLMTILVEIEGAFRKDGVPATLLDLPVLPAIRAASESRSAERERLRQSAEAREKAACEAREERLVRAARNVLGNDADAWLGAVVGQDSKSRREVCRISEVNLERLLNALEGEYRRREAEEIRAAESKRVIAEFTRKATDEVGPDRAHMLLHNVHPALGGRPINLLADANNLERCLAIIPSKRGRSRR